MFQSLVSQARANGGGSQEHIEAVTAERDFFREKYAAQMNEMEHLKSQLKESRRVIDRLRKQVLDLEMQRSGSGGCVNGVATAGGASAKNKALAGLGSSNTSLTSMTYGEEESIRSSPCSVAESLQADEERLARDSGGVEDKNARQELTGADNSEKQEQSTHDGDDEAGEHKSNSTEEKEEEDMSSDKDEADQIRANAERMLQWANYQTTRRTTVSPSTTPTAKRTGEDENECVYNLTELDRTFGDESENSFLTSPQDLRNDSYQLHTPSSHNQGKISKFLNKVKDIIDPPSEYESESDDESSEEESTSTIDHRSFDE
ncbi:hypothetical protein HJC23_013418 [Cyclotella cryptica]|uniref:Uncharacterized protein n=1 Tax=Cyclotella cryptica TaxID=29204 RepID=A0ABD3P620_9STRA